MVDVTDTADNLERALQELSSSPPVETVNSLSERIQLCRQCLDGVIGAAHEWARSSAAGKGCEGNQQVIAEELLGGPAVVARQLRLTIQTLTAIDNCGHPVVPGGPRKCNDGQVIVPAFPTRGLFDSLTFMGLRAAIHMQPGVSRSQIHGQNVERVRDGAVTGITAVLGAGNVSSIPVTDSLNRIMFEGRRVILKLNPVNDYLRTVFEQVLAPLRNARLLRIITGGVNIGRQLVYDARVRDVHVTGSRATHDAIVWGPTADEQARRKRTDDPLLNKSVTSELGNVTPWIIAPGRYSSRELSSQASHMAASLTNNASFNCVATRVIITWDKWEQRDQFLALLRQCLADTPPRPAYYPGAAKRFQRFSGSSIDPDDNNRLPWTVLERQSIEDRPELFTEESFVCVCTETTLPAASPEQFLNAATDFANDRMTGTLCASVTLPTAFRKHFRETVQRCLRELRYGSVCVNQWSGLAYGLTSPPWGAYPGATLQNVESGIGSVHNVYLLDRFQKTVLEGPLVNFPKPAWFPSHANALKVSAGLLALYDRPSVWRLPGLFRSALMG
jgi:hypothetical protein